MAEREPRGTAAPPGQGVGGVPAAPKEPIPEAVPETVPVALETHEGPLVAAPEREVLRPPARRKPAAEWVRENLFNTWYDALLTLALVAALGYAALRAVRFVFVTADWEILRVNLLLFMVFRFPRDQLWRLAVAGLVAAAAVGLAAGMATAVRRTVADGTVVAPSTRMTARRLAPVVALVVALLALVQTATPMLLVLAVAAAAVTGNHVGRRLPVSWGRWVNLVALASVVGAYLVVSQFGGVGYAEWGGLLLTVFLAAGGIVLSFPLGVLLALGRRSSLPAVRALCVAYIELIRGVPLVTLLFMAFLVIRLFLPPDFPNPEQVTRALIAIVLFTAAYVAEIVRGGLQSVPRGQVEAAQALGLSPLATIRRVVLPQALRAVIPALVGQFISLYKDTSLVAIIGLTDLLRVATQVTKQPQFLAQGRIAETLVFAGFVYWVGSYSMSRESQRLERRLGVGLR